MVLRDVQYRPCVMSGTDPAYATTSDDSFNYNFGIAQVPFALSDDLLRPWPQMREIKSISEPQRIQIGYFSPRNQTPRSLLARTIIRLFLFSFSPSFFY